MRGGFAFLAAGAIFLAGCERPQPETMYYAVKLEYIPSSDAPAVSAYHEYKGA